MKLSFIHLGFNKTGSTYLQNNLFKKQRIFIILIMTTFLWFYKNFVNINLQLLKRFFFE